MSIEIPLKAKNDDEFTTLKKLDKEIIVYAVLCQTDNQTAFIRFHPEFAIQVGKTTSKYALSDLGKRECKNFWSYPKNRAYREAYEQTLAEFLGRSDKVDIGNELDELTEERKEKASKLLMLEVIKMIEAGKISDPEFAKLVTDLAIKMKITKEDVERVIAPIRVIPTRCKSECRYRLFVETAKLEKQICDDCDYCKARKFAEEHGFVYDPCTVLDLPEDVITEIDSHNDVKLLDILDGKVEN